jgi:hypothetical protein
MAGTAVLRIVVSSDSMKKATATSHGRKRLEDSEGTREDGEALNGPHGVAGRRLREGSSATHIFARTCSSVRCSCSCKIRVKTCHRAPTPLQRPIRRGRAGRSRSRHPRPRRIDLLGILQRHPRRLPPPSLRDSCQVDVELRKILRGPHASRVPTNLVNVPRRHFDPLSHPLGLRGIAKPQPCSHPLKPSRFAGHIYGTGCLIS